MGRRLRARRSDDGRRKVAITYGKDQLDVAGQKAPLKLAEGEDAVMLVVFLDKSVLEVYGQNGRVCVTRVIDANPADLNVELVAPAALHVEKLKTWPMQASWSH